MRTFVICAFLFGGFGGLGGCGSSTSPVDGGGHDQSVKHDLAPAHDLFFNSQCGHPGDTGNSLGVGKFCTMLSDCSSNTKATLCTTLGSSDEFFCTMLCSSTGPANQCGENARCACDNGQCGCYPTACDKNAD